MRIISGSARGHKLKAPKGRDTRPTADRVKESLFNIIFLKIKDAEVLDLFSGTGNLGIEALSRGAKRAVFVDKSHECGKLIEENLKHTKLDMLGQILVQDVLSAVQMLGTNNRKFDIIFLDPPYDKGWIDPVLDRIVSSGIFKSDGIILCEKRITDKLEQQGLPLENYRNEKYGDTEVCFFRNPMQ